MYKIYKINILIIVLFGLISINFSQKTEDEKDLTENWSGCGGEIVSDSGVLTYSGQEGQVAENELCIWTLHLKSGNLTGFKLNFTRLDFNGGDADCTEGAVRLYSLSNLFISEELENYKVCSENRIGGGLYYLSGSALVITFRTSENNSGGGQGFFLSWEPNKFSPVSINHASFYENSSSDGFVTFPNNGENYLNSLVGTWLVVGNGQLFEVYLNYLNIGRECGVFRCYCDAFVFYTISANGDLEDFDRYCSNATNVYIASGVKNFLIGFYTDALSSSSGFEFNWYEESFSTTFPPSSSETTTVSYPTPEPPGPTDCGGVITLNGPTPIFLEYSLDELYKNDERCIWTVRGDSISQFRVNLIEYYLQIGDVLSVHSFNPVVLASQDLIPLSNTLLDCNRTSITPSAGDFCSEGIVYGPTVFISFTSNKDIASRGFKIQITPVQILSVYPFESNFIDYSHVIESDAGSGLVKHPSDGTYKYKEFSTFFVNPRTRVKNLFITLGAFDINTDVDSLYVFEIKNSTLTEVQRIRDASDFPPTSVESLVVVFRSHSTGEKKNGFTINWFLV